MERLLDAWATPAGWTGDVSPIGDSVFYAPYLVKRHASLALRGTCVYTFAEPVPCLDFLSFSCQGEIRLTIDGVPYSVEARRDFTRAHFPAPPQISEVTLETPYAVVSDLRTWTEELPADILDALIDELQPLLPRIASGELRAWAGAKSATLLTDLGFVEKNQVIVFGDETHEIRNAHERELEFYSAFDGETIARDYSGSFDIAPVIKKGYYDREIALPSVTLWYDAPRPHNISGGLSRRQFSIGDAWYSERAGKNYTWDITVEIVARSPQMLQTIAAVIRDYLARETVWLHGLKTWFRFTETVVNDEPAEAYDILPRVVYRVSIDIEEGNEWQSETLGKSMLTMRPPIPYK